MLGAAYVRMRTTEASTRKQFGVNPDRNRADQRVAAKSTQIPDEYINYDYPYRRTVQYNERDGAFAAISPLSAVRNAIRNQKEYIQTRFGYIVPGREENISSKRRQTRRLGNIEFSTSRT